MFMLMKLKLAVVAGAVCAPLFVGALAPPTRQQGPDTSHLLPGSFQYRGSGEFSREQFPINAPLRNIRFANELVIMKRLVTVGEYGRCVAEAECPPVSSEAAADSPIIGVNWHDATAYAAWLSRKTGRHYRLPTDEEWTFAAAEKATDEALPLIDPADPAQAWIARYEAESSRTSSKTRQPPSSQALTSNSNGLHDVAAGIWEWTDTCFIRARFENDQMHVTNVNCGVRVVEGSHRSYMTDFIRDPKSGGCAVGIPPSALGFRLVVQSPRSLVSQIVRSTSRLLSRS